MKEEACSCRTEAEGREQLLKVSRGDDIATK